MRVNGTLRNEKITDISEPVVNSGTKARIHNVFIIDASGSMSGDKYITAISGVNELLKSIISDIDTDNNAMVVEFEGDTIARRLELNDKIPTSYLGKGTGGMTPLNQAIGETLKYVYEKRKKDYSENDKVLVNIFTDGGENSSSGPFANSKNLSKYIKELENEGFTITFVGTQYEVEYAINTLSMNMTNTLVHNNTSSDISRAFGDTVLARTRYSKTVSAGGDVTRQFYTKTINK